MDVLRDPQSEKQSARLSRKQKSRIAWGKPMS
jgi:hypothetical protein